MLLRPMILFLPVLLAAGLLLAAVSARGEDGFQTGLEVAAAKNFLILKGRKVGVVTNPTGVDRKLSSIIDLLAKAGSVRLVAVFGPEHGARGGAAAGVGVHPRVVPAGRAPAHGALALSHRGIAPHARGQRSPGPAR